MFTRPFLVKGLQFIVSVVIAIVMMATNKVLLARAKYVTFIVMVVELVAVCSMMIFNLCFKLSSVVMAHHH